MSDNVQSDAHSEESSTQALHAHGPLRFAIPPSWSDQSTLMFAGPLSEGEQQAPVVTVTFSLAKADARKTAVAEVERMAEAVADLKLMEEGPIETAFGEGWSVRVVVERGHLVLTQLTCTQQVGPMMLLMTGLCEEAHYDAHKEALLQMMTSVRPS
ncbi:MAG: DUF1795 domain-containing protein [Deltaproteobacteria bacterium]|nr:DUF1795 domain-containing protein [Deltaproteobacteria bacterium]